MTEKRNVSKEDFTELRELNYAYNKKSLGDYSDEGFFDFIQDNFYLKSSPMKHPLFFDLILKNRNKMISLLDAYGFVFDDNSVDLKPIQGDVILPLCIDGENSFISENMFTDGTRTVFSYTELIHLGKLDCNSFYKKYNNHILLKEKGIWGDEEGWTYVASNYIHPSRQDWKSMLLYIDRDILLEMRDLYIDPAGINRPYEFGKAFMFKGGIPKEAINKIEVLNVDAKERNPDFVNPIATLSLDEFFQDESERYF